MPALTPPTQRILITADAVGGVWRYALEIASELNRRGARATMVGMGPPPTPAQQREAAMGRVELIWLDAELDWMSASACNTAAAAAALDRIAAHRQATILHVNAPPLAAHVTYPCPLVVACHSCISTWWRTMRSEPLPAEWTWHRKASADGLVAADAIVAPSRAFADLMREVYGRLPSLHVVHNGSVGVGTAAKQPYVLAVGRWWDEAKNARVLDEAARRCRWPVRLLGPSSGPNGTAIQIENAEALGDRPYDETQALIAEAAVFAAPSHYEPFGLAVLEAASAGAALVLSDIPTFRELWDGCALFVDARDPSAFAWALNRLAESDEERRQLGAAASARAERYTICRQAEKLLGIYVAAAEARARRTRGAA